MDEDVEETNSGVKKKGNWKEVAEFGEEVEEAIKNEADDESIEEFEEWRPKETEAENDMKKKTVDKAVINKNKMEEESNGVKEDIKDATEEVAKAGKKASRKKPPKKEVTKASEDVARPFFSKVSKVFRKIESVVYSKVALKDDRYYFDTEELSADMKSRKDGDYEMEVNAMSDGTRKRLKEEFDKKDE